MLFVIIFLFVIFQSKGNPNFVLIGPPGSGKGTFSSLMVEKYGYYQISPGDILRTHIKQETELGKKIKPIVEQGNYIDDSITLAIMLEQITYCLNNKKPFIIDGFPRSKSTFAELNKFFEQSGIKSFIYFVHLDADDKTCIERINSRLVCFSCFNVFNNTSKLPKEPMKCDRCHSSLEVRLGDSCNNTIKRLAYYRNQIEPLVEVAKKLQFKTFTFDGTKPIDICFKNYINLIEIIAKQKNI